MLHEQYLPQMVTFDQRYRYHDLQNVSSVQHLITIRLVGVGRDSPVDIATRYGLDGPGIKRRWGWRDFPHPFRPALGTIQPPVQRVPGLFPGSNAVDAWRSPATPI